jgi:hypothetical protein
MLEMRSKRSVNGFGSSVCLVTCATVRHVVRSYNINSLASMTSASCSSNDGSQFDSDLDYEAEEAEDDDD